MSIINDALKKADYLKKWKNFSQGTAEPSAESHRAQGIATQESSRQPVAEERIRTVKVEAPSFSVPRNDSKQNSLSFANKLRFKQILLIGCGLLILSIVLWFFMRSTNISEQNTEVAQGKKQALTTPVRIIEPTRVASSKSSNSNPKKTFKPYKNQNIAPSVKPTPRTIRDPKSIYHLTGVSILNNGKQRYAFINGKMVEVGDQVSDLEVTSIEEKKVIVRRGDKEFTLFLE